jgi:MFS family permease
MFYASGRVGGGLLGGLWRHPDFVKLWAGHTISRFGSEISQLAIPLTAALVLNASAFQMGLLGTFEFAPFLILSLFAGVWVDRLRRQPILIVADIGRFLLLASIPLAAIFNQLRIEQLYVVGLLTGVLTVFFDVADQSYLPVLVRREHLVEGNSKLEMSRSVAQIAGPGVAGGLVQLVTAPIAVAVDALSFLASAVFLLFVRTTEPAQKREPHHPSSIWGELREGLAAVLGNPLLRSIAGATATSNLFGNAMQAVYILYVTRELGLGPAILGIILACGGPGALLGAVLAGRAAGRFGLGITIIGSLLITEVANLLVPLTGLSSMNAAVVVGMLTLAIFIGGIGNPIYNINQVSLRQAITPDRLQGRMNASMRFIVWGTIPLGSLLGGALGDAIGLWPTLVSMAVCSLLAPGWIVFSPVRRLKEQPAPV